MTDDEQARQVKQAVTGDLDALQRLIVGYHPALRVAVNSKLDGASRRHVDAEDVLQEAYAAAFKDVTGCQFTSAAAFYKWLETIALDRLRDKQRALRRKKRDIAREVQPATLSASAPDLLNRIASPDSTPSRKLARDEAISALLTSLARLTQDQRDVVRLRYLEHMPVAEVAAKLGKTEAAVHMLCHRGLKALRTFMVSISRYMSRG